MVNVLLVLGIDFQHVLGTLAGSENGNLKDTNSSFGFTGFVDSFFLVMYEYACHF